jgi:hypothetical protein
MDILLGPDVLVNASVALGSPPEQVVRRVLGKTGGKPRTTEWVLGRVASMLEAVPSFRKDSIHAQMDLVRALVEIAALPAAAPTASYAEGLVASAKAAGYGRVVTDHPDLADQTELDGIQFVSSEAWLVEATTPPPPPTRSKGA